VVLPIRDEAEHLRQTIASILAQDYPGAFDVCLAVAPSADGTEQIAADLAAADPRVTWVPNPAGTTPAALNAAIAASTGAVIVRVDGHAELPAGYICRAVETMQATGAVNVGGLQLAVGTTAFEQAVAVAMTSWFGTGGSRFHVGGQAGSADTVYLGVFDRAALVAVGGFDETLIRNQDYEANIRLRRAGGLVWFDPELAVVYRPRSSLRRLAGQYHEYGFWKYRVARRYPTSLRARQLAPVVVTAAVVGGLAVSPWRLRAALLPAGYAAAVVLVARFSSSDRAERARLALIFPTMHLAWGLGFLRAAAAGELRFRCPRRPR
jgi:succinoglycan biosynthesis protein ExoA